MDIWSAVKQSGLRMRVAAFAFKGSRTQMKSSERSSFVASFRAFLRFC